MQSPFQSPKLVALRKLQPDAFLLLMNCQSLLTANYVKKEGSNPQPRGRISLVELIQPETVQEAQDKAVLHTTAKIDAVINLAKFILNQQYQGVDLEIVTNLYDSLLAEYRETTSQLKREEQAVQSSILEEDAKEKSSRKELYQNTVSKLKDSLKIPNPAIKSDNSLWIPKLSRSNKIQTSKVLEALKAIPQFDHQNMYSYNPNSGRRMTNFQSIERSKIVSMLFSWQAETLNKGKYKKVFIFQAISLMDQLIFLWKDTIKEEYSSTEGESLELYFQTNSFAFCAFEFLLIIAGKDLQQNPINLSRQALLFFKLDFEGLMNRLVEKRLNAPGLFSLGILFFKKWNLFVLGLKGLRISFLHQITYNNKPKKRRLLVIYLMVLEASVYTHSLLAQGTQMLCSLALHYALRATLQGELLFPADKQSHQVEFDVDRKFDQFIKSKTHVALNRLGQRHQRFYDLMPEWIQSEIEEEEQEFDKYGDPCVHFGQFSFGSYSFSCKLRNDMLNKSIAQTKNEMKGYVQDDELFFRKQI